MNDFKSSGRRASRLLIAATCGLLAWVIAVQIYQASQRSAYLDGLFASKGTVTFSGDFISTSKYDVEKKGLSLWKRGFAPIKGAYVPGSVNAELLQGLHWFGGVTDLQLATGNGQDVGELANLSSLRRLRLWSKSNPDAAAGFISQLSELDSLTIDGDEPLTDAGLQSLASLKKLTFLELRQPTITDAGLQSIQDLPLVHLYVDGSQVTDKGLRSLEKMPLYRLRVRNTGVTNRGLQTLKSKIKDLETVPEGLPDVKAEAEAVAKLTGMGFELTAAPDGSIAQAELTRVRVVDLGDNGESTPLFDEASVWLEQLPRLKKLRIDDLEASTEGLKRLSSLQTLEELVLLSADVDDNGAAQIAKLRGLKVLRLNDSPLTDAGVESLAPLEQLETLYLPGAKVKGAGLRKLDRFSRLKVLSLEACPLEDEYMESLTKFPSLSWVSLDGTPLTDESIPHLSKLRGFERVLIEGTQISDDGARKLQESIRR